MPSAQIFDELTQFTAERANHTDTGERFADASVDQFRVLPQRAIDRPHTTRLREAQEHDAGNNRQRHQRQAPVERREDDDRNEQADRGNGRRHDRELQQPGRRLHVTCQPRQDAARLHVPQCRQRQVKEAVVERAAQRQHHARVEQPLPVISQSGQHAFDDDDDQKRQAGGVKQPAARGGVEIRNEQDAIDDEPHEQRLDHLQAGDAQRQNDDDGEGDTVRP